MESYAVTTPERQSHWKERLKILFKFRKALILILAPIIFLPLIIIIPTRPAKCAYAILVMGAYWVSEALPIAVTALLPIVMMPPLGVMGSKPLCMNYLKDTNFLFVGGLIVAVAVERWNLHRRMALRVLLLVGSKPRWLLFGFMSMTAFLSMWISNTATTAMMTPIAAAVLTQLGECRHPKQMNGEAKNDKEKESNIDDVDANESKTPMLEEDVAVTIMDASNGANHQENSLTDKEYDDMCKGMTLSIAYAANIGGMATLTGTGPNLILSGNAESMFGEEAGINFSSWFVFAFPTMLLCLLVAWIWLQLKYLGWRTLCACFLKTREVSDERVHLIIRNEYNKLGPMTFAEIAVLCHFILLAILWFTRNPQFIPGWSSVFEEGFVTDASTGMTIAVSLFIFPSKKPKIFCCKAKEEEAEPVPALLDWETFQKNFAWNIPFVLGGSFAIADACGASGLSQWLGDKMAVFAEVPAWAFVIIICTVIGLFTEITSNTATASIFIPILAQLGVGMGVNPLLYMIPATLACSFAFMLPVASPPNAIVFTYGKLRIIDMVQAGVVMNIVCLLIVTFTVLTWGTAFFHLNTFPDWAANKALQTLGNNTIGNSTGLDLTNITAIYNGTCNLICG
ncbi:unnamed protein product [Owenia fusiformis]|uniref:Uncharacterized protein n=1 Tax=Owenia fusiformis TaxID=6347 RepID=A0A8J1TUM8_OWEFU|nr:unnamed protein product [Owenia fusiformis]